MALKYIALRQKIFRRLLNGKKIIFFLKEFF
jgi:hypothetical protein